MEFVATTERGEVVRYLDRKRYAWLAALISPCLGLATALLYQQTRSAWFLFLPLAYAFLLLPLLDGLIGEDAHNPPDAVVPLMAGDAYYRALMYVDIALLYASFGVLAWIIGTYDLPWWGYLGGSLSAGLTHADVIFIGHELGHKRNRLDRATAAVALSLVGYGHFSVEHNRGHHLEVATPEDSASARMGESVYRFALREVPGALTRAFRLEKERLATHGRGPLTWRNQILRAWALTLLIAGFLLALCGLRVLPFLVIHHLYAWYGLTQANYVEHYGLLREKLPCGDYEPPQPRHSWNANHIFSNIVTLHLQRHSDHHANASRPYQVLRDFDDLPRLPSGYPGCFGLALVPSAWFKVMDPKLLEWCGGDLSKLNIAPARRAAIYAKYGGAQAPAQRHGETM